MDRRLARTSEEEAMAAALVLRNAEELAGQEHDRLANESQHGEKRRRDRAKTLDREWGHFETQLEQVWVRPGMSCLRRLT